MTRSADLFEKYYTPLVIFSVTLALLVQEIMLSAVLHVVVGAYSTLIAISVAMLGMSASGVVSYLVPGLRQRNIAPATRDRFLSLFVVAGVANIVLIMNLPVNHADFAYSPTAWTAIWKLVAYVSSTVPFFLGGMCVNLGLRSAPREVGRLYFYDLCGAALGCLLASLCITWLGAPGAIVASVGPGLALLSLRATRRRERRMLVVAPLGTLILFTGLELAGVPLLDVKRFNTLGEVDDLRHESFRASSSELEFERWALDAWTIIRGEEIPQQWQNFRGWGLSDRYDGEVPGIRLINFNMRFTTYATEFDGDFGKLAAWLDADLISSHFLLGRRFDRVLNIGAGGGREVLNALHHGASEVVAVDISDATVNEIMRGPLKDFSGNLYGRPDVRAIADEGRSFVERTEETFDLIDFTIVGGTNLEKLDILRVDNLFTREALDTYLDRLAPDGVFSYVMYTTRSDLLREMTEQAVERLPYLPAVKTMTGLRAVFEERNPGATFSDHVLVAAKPGVIDKNYDLAHIVFSKTPFTTQERRRFLEDTDRLGFVALHPVLGSDTNLYAEVATVIDLEALVRESPLNVGPIDDDRPFHYALKSSGVGFGTWLRLMGQNPLVRNGLLFAAVAAVVLVAPLLLTESSRGTVPRPKVSYLLLYFAAIGCGYMVVEMAVLLRLQVYLGRPVYSLSVALFSFLLASGLGSRFSGALASGAVVRNLAAIVFGIVVYGALFSVLWPVVFDQTLSLGQTARGITAVLAIGPLAFLMGMLFPIGIRQIAPADADMIPWVWAVNGSLSIVGIFLGRILGLLWGFDVALALGLACYGATVLAMWVYLRGPVHAPREA